MWRTKLSVFPFFFPKSPRQACFRRIFSVFRRPEFAIHGDKPAQVENFFEIVRHIIKIQQQCVEFPDASSRRRGRPGRCRAPSSFDLPRAGLGPASAPQSTGLFRFPLLIFWRQKGFAICEWRLRALPRDPTTFLKKGRSKTLFVVCGQKFSFSSSMTSQVSASILKFRSPSRAQRMTSATPR